MSKKPLNEYFDHTALKPETKVTDIERLCEEAKKYGFYAVCVNSCYVPLAKELLSGTATKISAVIGFPLGACSTDVKSYETDYVCQHGADEIDMVINIGYLKDKRYEDILDDISTVVAIADEYDNIVKVILETGLLSDDEIVKACELSKKSGAAFVKTSSGFYSTGATVHHIKLMKSAVGDDMQIKAAGGIKDLKTALEMIEAGADRIGASASVSILKEAALI